MYSRTTDDYEKMALAGIRAVIEPSFWLGQERTSSKTLEDYWEYLITFEKNRAAEFGIDHYSTIAINPKEANNKYYNMTPVDPNSTQLLQGMHKWVYIGGNFFGVTDKAIINKQLTIEELKNE